MMTGGVHMNRTSQESSLATLSSVEIYVPSSRLSYSCPALPDVRFGHVQERSQYCGGLGTYSFANGLSCYSFTEGSWQSSANLSHLSLLANSFDSSAGLVIMGALELQGGLGGENMSSQALLVDTSGGSGGPRALFNLTAPAL